MEYVVVTSVCSQIYTLLAHGHQLQKCARIRFLVFGAAVQETHEGKRLKQPGAPPDFQTIRSRGEASVFWWPRTQTSATGLELLSDPADLNLSALSFLGPFQSHRG